MNSDSVYDQPSLRTQIRRGYFILIIGLGVWSALLVLTTWYAGGLSPTLLDENYRSIQYARQMESAIVSIFISAGAGKPSEDADVKRFEENLQREKENITEPGETEIVDTIESQWKAFRAENQSSSAERYRALVASLKDLTQINERGMYLRADRAQNIRLGVVSFGAVGLVLVLMYAFIIADSKSELILKAVTESQMN